MAGSNVEERLQEVRRLKGLRGDDVESILRKALRDRSAIVVAEAARVVGSARFTTLKPDLLVAFEKLFVNPAKADPKCLGKTAIVKALVTLEHEDSPPFLQGARHIQMEPVWGGQEDTAIHLRASSVLALVQSTDISRAQIFRHLVDALADPSDVVRIEAVRAVEQLGGEEAAIVLRLKAHWGDERPPVIGMLFDALLRLEPDAGVDFVAGFLRSASLPARDEAALALGNSHRPAAARILLGLWDNNRDREFAPVLLRAMSLSRDESAIQSLLQIVRDGLSRDAELALEALDLHRDSSEILQRVEQARRERKA